MPRYQIYKEIFSISNQSWLIIYIIIIISSRVQILASI
jgi:hypothetical protein